MKKNEWFWGITFILIGAFIIVNKLGYFSDVNIITILLTAALVITIVKNIFKMEFAGIIFPIAFLCIIYDEELGITRITPWTVLLAALFLTIGFSMIFNRNKFKFHYHSKDNEYKFEEIDVEDTSYIKYKNSFNASIKYINSDNFESADFQCSFGAMKIYFDNAVMVNDSATVRLNASFSGVELYVPRNWKVLNKANLCLSSVDEKNRPSELGEKTLILTGDIKFAGVEIIYI
ncbi:LiaF transmembrane domain-containing protein [Haloimpatiens sp. FM7315]|uniref:LiaF transmembrane domain-containing protein n=1 Tax=Haloimpatiens sp. FM7315 TaxID=3298609 RepID=UPI00370BE2C0